MSLIVWVIAIVVAILLVYGLARPSRIMKDEKGRLIPGTLIALLRMHQAGTKALKDPTSIMNSRIGFARSIGLGEILLQFHEGVRHMPSWYTLKERFPSAEAWTSNVIGRDEIATVKIKDLSAYGIEVPDDPHASDDPDISDDRDAVVLQFSSSGKQYVFCAHECEVPGWITNVADKPDWMFTGLKAYVVELPSHVVLEDRVIYESGDLDEYHSDHVECFRPDEWLVTLYKTANAVEAEADTKHKEFTRRFEAERAKKFT